MTEQVRITIDDKTYDYPVLTGTEKEKGVDISSFRADTKYITLDSGFGNTGACTSAITFLNGEKGILRYRGIPIEQIAEQASFIETAYLLSYGELPTKTQLQAFHKAVSQNYAIDEKMLQIAEAYPKEGHPMGLLMALVSSMAGYYPKLAKPVISPETIDQLIPQLIAKISTFTALIYRHSQGKKFIAPDPKLGYVENFLHMLFGKDYKAREAVVRALDVLFILHADHEQNCSTSTVRLVGSSWSNLYASVAGGIGALWGPLHGGANQKVVEMLQEIQTAGGDVKKFIARAKDPEDNYRLMGFGHRVNKNFDPRATIIKQRCHDLFAELKLSDPLLDIAVELESIVLEDEYFVERKLYPNVDFYSGIIYKQIGIPTEMFTVLFAIGRLPGWLAHWKEMKEDPKAKIGRPRQIYTGPQTRDYVPLDQRAS